MCTANNNAAATTKTAFYKNPTFWRGAGTGLAIGAGTLEAGSAYNAGLSKAAYLTAEAANTEKNAVLGEITAKRQVGYDMQATAKHVQQVRRSGRKNYASQLVAAAANGIDFSSVSFQDVILDSQRAEQEDIDLIKRTAQQKANETLLQAELNTIDAKSQAEQARIAARLAKKAGRINMYSSLLSTASSVAGIWAGGIK